MLADARGSGFPQSLVFLSYICICILTNVPAPANGVKCGEACYELEADVKGERETA